MNENKNRGKCMCDDKWGKCEYVLTLHYFPHSWSSDGGGSNKHFPLKLFASLPHPSKQNGFCVIVDFSASDTTPYEGKLQLGVYFAVHLFISRVTEIFQSFFVGTMFCKEKSQILKLNKLAKDQFPLQKIWFQFFFKCERICVVVALQIVLQHYNKCYL